MVGIEADGRFQIRQCSVRILILVSGHPPPVVRLEILFIEQIKNHPAGG
jgi:hypothetical protein